MSASEGSAGNQEIPRSSLQNHETGEAFEFNQQELEQAKHHHRLNVVEDVVCTVAQEFPVAELGLEAGDGFLSYQEVTGGSGINLESAEESLSNDEATEKSELHLEAVASNLLNEEAAKFEHSQGAFDESENDSLQNVDDDDVVFADAQESQEPDRSMEADDVSEYIFEDTEKAGEPMKTTSEGEADVQPPKSEKQRVMFAEVMEEHFITVITKRASSRPAALLAALKISSQAKQSMAKTDKKRNKVLKMNLMRN